MLAPPASGGGESHATLWAHVRDDEGADFVQRYTHLVSEGDLQVGDDPVKAARWYRHAGDFAAGRLQPGLEVAALFYSAWGFFVHWRDEEFLDALKVCFDASIRCFGRPAWFEAWCGDLLHDQRVAPTPAIAAAVRAGAEFATRAAERRGPAVLLLPNRALQIPVMPLALRLLDVTDCAVEVEVASGPWTPEQVDAIRATSVVDFGSGMTQGAGLVRRYVPARDWYPWPNDRATGGVGRIRRVETDHFRFCLVGGYGTADVALSAQDAAENPDLMRWLCGM